MRVRSALAALLLLLPALAASAETVLLTGTVTDLGGRPLKNVTVTGLVEGEEAPTARTDQDGLFWIEVPAAISLRFTLDGFLGKEVVPSAGEEDLAVRLVQAASLTILVRDKEKKTIKGAEVALYDGSLISRRGSFWVPDDAEPLFEAKADGKGEAHFAGIPPGLYAAQARAKGFRPGRETGVLLRSGHSRRLEVRLRPALSISGRVEDERGKPLAGARYATFGRGREIEETRPPSMGYVVEDWKEVDKEGRYHVEVQHSGFQAVVAVAPGRAPAFLRCEGKFEDDRLEHDLQPPPAATIRGRVVDETETGVPGLRILATVLPVHTDPRTGEEGHLPGVDLLSVLPSVDREEGVFSDEEGRFVIPEVPPGRVRLVAWREGHPRQGSSPVTVEAGMAPEEALLKWKEGASLDGLVEDEQGEPIEGAELEVESRRLATVTDAAGRFHLSGLEGEKVGRLKVTAPGYGVQTRKDIPLDGEPVRIRLRPAGAMEGRVFDAGTGQPIQVFVVRAEPLRSGVEVLGEKTEQTFSDPEGRFLLENVSAGRYDVVIVAPDFLRETLEQVEVRVGEETPLPPVNLERGREVSGTVIDRADGSPVEGAAVLVGPVGQSTRWWGGGRALGNPFETESDAEGRYRIAGIPPSDLNLYASHPDYAREQHAVAFGEGEDSASVDILMGAGGTVEVTLLDMEGDPVPGKRIQLRRAKEPANRHQMVGRTDQDGKAILERVAPGAWIASEREGAAREELEVRDGQTLAVVLKQKGTLLSGRLTWRGGPLQGANLFFMEKDGDPGRMRFTRAEIEGERYTAGPLAPGTYEVRGWGAAPIPDQPGETARVQLHEEISIVEGVDGIERDFAFPDRRFAGRVVRKDTGEPVERALVVLRPVGGEPSGWSSGRSSGWSQEVHGWRLAEEMRVTIPEKAGLSGQVIIVEPGGVLKGRVTDREGRPVRGAWLDLWDQARLASAKTLPFWAELRERKGESAVHHVGGKAISRWSDDEGNYRLEGVATGSGLLYVSHRDYAPAWIPGLSVGVEETTQDVVLSPGGSVELLLPDTWTSSREVDIRLTAPGLPLPVEALGQMEAWSSTYRYRSATGSIVFPHVPPGTWTMEITKKGSAAHRKVVEVREGERSVVDLTEIAEP